MKGKRELSYNGEVSVTESQKPPPVLARDICSDPYVEAVVKKLRDRSIAGKLKYGVGLDRTDLSTLQWMQHLQEELMDAANYIERLMHDYKQASIIFDAISKLNQPKK